MSKYFVIGRSCDDGGICIYTGDSADSLRNIEELIVQSEPINCVGDDALEMIGHIEQQIYFNEKFKTPVALSENWAITFNEAVGIVGEIKKIQEAGE